MNLTTKDFWETRWENEPMAQSIEMSTYHELFEKYLPKGGSYMEIGCTPGTNLAYFNKFFGYEIAGIDYADAEITKRTLEQLGITNYELFVMDFTKELPDKRYDVVGSFGFIEHFENLDDIIHRHIQLLKQNGTLILTIPHFRNFQYLLRTIYDKDVLAVHNLEIMKPDILREIVLKYGAKKIHYCNYYLTYRFWIDNESINKTMKKFVYKGCAIIEKLLSTFKLDKVPNRFFSPYIVVVAEF